MDKKQDQNKNNPSSSPKQPQTQKPAQFPGNKNQPQKKSNW